MGKFSGMGGRQREGRYVRHRYLRKYDYANYDRRSIGGRCAVHNDGLFQSYAVDIEGILTVKTIVRVVLILTTCLLFMVGQTTRPVSTAMTSWQVAYCGSGAPCIANLSTCTSGSPCQPTSKDAYLGITIGTSPQGQTAIAGNVSIAAGSCTITIQSVTGIHALNAAAFTTINTATPLYLSGVWLPGGIQIITTGAGCSTTDFELWYQVAQ